MLPPTYTPSVRERSLLLQAACSDGTKIHLHPGFPGNPGLFSGPRGPSDSGWQETHSTHPPGLFFAFPRGAFFAAECLGKRSNKFTASLMNNLLSGALRKQRAELTRLN